jgi:hypothetical protein
MTITAANSGVTGQALARSSASRFFWAWLIVATSVSVTGNVTHAVINASQQTVWIAAGAALVPPGVLLAATHSVAVLVKSRTGGLTYWGALSMTIALTALAFVLSFAALRDLAITAGIGRELAWLWPCAIDVSIAQATLCLLSLTRPDRMPGAEPTPQADRVPPPTRSMASSHTRARTAQQLRSVTAAAALDAAALMRWQPIADALVRDRVTSKDPELVASILAQRAAGTPPATIGRLLAVHHTTVGRILTAAEDLAVPRSAAAVR